MRGNISGRTAVRIAALTAAIALAAGLSATAPAPAQTWNNTGSADDLRYRLSVIDAELADIRARLGVTAPAASGPAAKATPGANGDLLVRLDKLEAELRQLTGRIEKMDFDQRKIAEDAAKRFGDIEFRLTELEGGDTSKLAPVPPLGSVATGEQVAAAQPKPEVSISERNDLDRAINDVKQGRFDIGEDRLHKFLTSYQGSPLEGEALYWLGESQFVRGNYQNAARSFLDGYNSDRNGLNAPRNLLRLGVTLGKLGQVNEACLTLKEVHKQFPKGPAEILQAADNETATLKCS
jgi:tol-pal system protein YbgF